MRVRKAWCIRVCNVHCVTLICLFGAICNSQVADSSQLVEYSDIDPLIAILLSTEPQP